jgi:hypothetical protein
MANSLGEMCLAEGNVWKKIIRSEKNRQFDHTQPMAISGLKINKKNSTCQNTKYNYKGLSFWMVTL